MDLKKLLFRPKQTATEREIVAHLLGAAENGDVHAQNELGRAHFLGSFGLPQDEVESVKWYRMAAEQNDAAAQYNLGWRYADGRGVPKDEAEAVKWYRKAAEQNHSDAQAHLGFCYYNGTGVAKDFEEAYKWEILARQQGRQCLSKTVIAVLEKKLTQEQIAKAIQSSREFKAVVVANMQQRH